METVESSLPPGFRFHPTDEELVGYYLRKKVASQQIDLDVIKEIDLYRIEPWDLQERCRVGYEEQADWYFFSHKDRKYPTGNRTNRATVAGFWKATGRDKAIYSKLHLIGMRKTLVFYKGRAPNGQKTDWIMHEYRLETDENAPPQEEGWVVCRAFKKKPTCQTRINEAWDANYFCEDHTHGVNNILDSIGFLSSQQPPLMFKQELEVENVNYSIDERFLQLPQLESPKVQLPRRSFTPLSMAQGENIPQLDCWAKNEDVGNVRERLTDWRALDRFVASQLSQEETQERYGANHEVEESDLSVHEDKEPGLIILETTKERYDQGDLIDHGLLMNWSPDCGVSTCRFEK